MKTLNLTIISLVIGLLMLTFWSGNAQEQGIPVFGDDFNVKGLFIENWEPSKGAKNEEGRAIIPTNNSMTLRRVPEGNFVFTADLIVEKPERKDIGHCGVILDGWPAEVIQPAEVVGVTTDSQYLSDGFINGGGCHVVGVNL